ncbi:MAG: bifunctional indole-3-glycerol phosphate synthase/phosphoribosylanthranilate isomerase [Spirochaetales bacterium]
MSGIRDQIVIKRKARIAIEGHTLGKAVPEARGAPLVPFLRSPGLICEIKRRSPSRGDIDASLDPVALAGIYQSRGVPSVSVLTEEDHFGGSLDDLMRIKREYPELSVLRKDFLVDEHDIEVSFRAGADAVLLIASVLSEDELARLHQKARSLGMAALVELHEASDFTKAEPLAPELVGINARNLSTFEVDLLTPVRLRSRITWEHRAVFESGAFYREDALLARTTGFDGLLVGEAAVRDQAVIPELIAGLRGEASTLGATNFWGRLMARREQKARNATGGPVPPLAKICGITNEEDARASVELGADLLGFVFAESPRQAKPQLLGQLRDLDVLKVAVVVAGGDHGPLPAAIAELLSEGLLDAVQFHGDELPEACAQWAFPYYKAIRVASPTDTAAIDKYRSPRVLVDARSERSYGGTGRMIVPETVRAAAEHKPLWLAGGLSHLNVREAVDLYRPELVDASSGLEESPGKKDHDALRTFLLEINNE